MELPATSPSTAINYPTATPRRPSPSSVPFRFGVGLCRRSTRIRALAKASKVHSLISASETRTDGRSLVAVELRNRNEKLWVNFVGIGGCGLCALAMLELKRGYEVSGSDVVWSSFMDGLDAAGARLCLGHSVHSTQKHDGLILPDAIVVSSTVPQDNVEILHAKSLGKSTTARMLAYVLKAMRVDITAVVGAHVPQFIGGNIILGRGDDFVLEADECGGCFLRLQPSAIVITNVEWDHVDIFENEDAVKATFKKFLEQIRPGGHLILCGDSVGARSLLGHERTVAGSDSSIPVNSRLELGHNYRVSTYGIANFNEWSASSLRSNWGCPVANISLRLPGVHDVLNLLAFIAAVTALFSGQRHIYESIDSVRVQLNSFRSVSRRFEIIGRVCGCHICDDYAHHPTEVLAVLQAARKGLGTRILWCRLAALENEFATAFHDADLVVVTEVYAARETNHWNISGRHLANSIMIFKFSFYRFPILVHRGNVFSDKSSVFKWSA
ncbi:UDP-N-acetylmuramate--L-alanine ligase [Bertholletia excelsa]